MPRQISEEEKQYAQELLQKARAAMKAIEDYDQARIDRLCQAVGWATANEETFTRLAHMGVEESGLGDWDGRPDKRFKIIGSDKRVSESSRKFRKKESRNMVSPQELSLVWFPPPTRP
jgi:hypothetical protein